MNLKVAESITTYDKSLSELLGEIAIEERVAVQNFMESVKSNQLASLTIFDYFEAGFSKEAALKVQTAIQFALKLRQFETPPSEKVRSPQEAYTVVSYLEHYPQEKFLVVALDTRNQVIAKKEIFTGTLDASIVHPREVFQFAIRHAASSILVAHQHPSGDPKESREDVEVTKRLAEAGKIIGIYLCDHIIVGSSNRYTSLKEKGFIQ